MPPFRFFSRPDRPDVFISYSHSDAATEFARRLAADLNVHGINAWVDVVEIALGESWERSIRHALRHARAVIVLVSQSAAESRWIEIELREAILRRKKIIPVLIEGDPALIEPLRLDGTSTIDARSDYQQAVITLVEMVNRL